MWQYTDLSKVRFISTRKVTFQRDDFLPKRNGFCVTGFTLRRAFILVGIKNEENIFCGGT